MIKEISISEALNRFMKDEDVKILVPRTGMREDWENVQAMYLGQYLEGVIFLADGPPKHVREEVVKPKEDIVFSDDPPIDTDDTAPDAAPDGLPAEYFGDPFEEEEEFDPEMEELGVDTKEREPEQKPKKNPRPKKYVDDGKIRALYETGTWTVKDIAEEMGLGQATVYNHLKKMGVDLTK